MDAAMKNAVVARLARWGRSFRLVAAHAHRLGSISSIIVMDKSRQAVATRAAVRRS